MKLYTVAVNILRKDAIHHCSTCSCRTEPILIGCDIVIVHDQHRTEAEMQNYAIGHVSAKWHKERSEDWGRYDFVALEPAVFHGEVV